MKRILLSGFVYTALGRYGGVVISLLVDIVLSRLLTPSDYGIVAVVNVFLIFFSLFSDSGIGTAVVQNRLLTKKEINILFTLSLVLALVLSLLFGFFGIAISFLYNSAVYKSLMWILSLAVFFSVFIAIPKAALLRDNKFGVINLLSLISSIFGGITGIILAYSGFGVFALVLSTVVTTTSNFVFIWYFSHVRLTRKINLNPARKIFSFSANNLGFSLLNQIAHNLAPILIGKFMTTSDAGNYNKAYRLILYPTAMFNGLIAPVLLPVLSKYHNDIKSVRDVYLKLQHITGLIALPLSIFLFFSADDVIKVFYGTRWVDAGLPLAILGLSVWAQMLNANAEPIFQIVGKVKILMKLGVRTSVINVIATILGVLTGNLILVSIFLLMSFTINGFYVSYLVMKYALDSTLWQLLKVLKQGLIISVIQGLLLLLFKISAINIKLNSLNILIIDLLIFTMSFILLIVVLGEMSNIKKILSRN
ncbi:lipopolysaccharide biosynthesis protein [Leuconostoc citreum]|uniref:lipopolysaccharide biosynthesis protein n=1 Tax=Leuconostoc citreum TaxID=33964 RepID=UPI002009F14D|nr:lipopolysaccharide biosynthesis protein [Leuconostoc citreum]MCK8604569.1 lipopolysaccharide biosynthesis protein [Leuconostoc citreum]